MSMRSLESSIAKEARQFFNNPKIRIIDLLEWCTGEIQPRTGEVVGRMPKHGVYVAISAEYDKRIDAIAKDKS